MKKLTNGEVMKLTEKDISSRVLLMYDCYKTGWIFKIAKVKINKSIKFTLTAIGNLAVDYTHGLGGRMNLFNFRHAKLLVLTNV